MTLRYVLGTVVMAALAGAVALEPSYAQSRDGGILPPGESGLVTVTGCLLRGNQVTGGQADKYVLANPRKDAAVNPTDSACSAEPAANALTLDNPEGRITEAMLGRWVVITGRLERENSTNPNTLRELDVESARLVAAAAPRAEAAPSPEPVAAAPAPQAAPEPQPAAPPREAAVATSGQQELPRTASYGPIGGLIGLMAVAASFALRSLRSPQLG